MQEIVIPKKLMPLITAFSADDQSAKLLIVEAAKTICKAGDTRDYGLDTQEITEDELEGIIALMKGIAPRDTLEMLYGAQIVTSHIMGLRLLRHNYPADHALGLKLLRFSNAAMISLQKKKAGGVSQNINITYNHAGTGPAVMQTILPKDQTCQ